MTRCLAAGCEHRGRYLHVPRLHFRESQWRFLPHGLPLDLDWHVSLVQFLESQWRSLAHGLPVDLD